MTAAVLSRRARNDLLGAVRWIAKDNPSAAQRLRDEVEVAAERIAEHPRIGYLRPELAGEPYRFLTLTGFPYLIVYNCERAPPFIVRIVHGARDLPDVLRDL